MIQIHLNNVANSSKIYQIKRLVQICTCTKMYMDRISGLTCDINVELVDYGTVIVGRRTYVTTSVGHFYTRKCQGAIRRNVSPLSRHLPIIQTVPFNDWFRYSMDNTINRVVSFIVNIIVYPLRRLFNEEWSHN